jgi:hypothetical protein
VRRLALPLCLLLVPAAARTEGPLPFTAEELVRKVAAEQGRVDRSLTDWVFDQVEVRTDHGKDGRPKTTRRRLFHYFSGERPGQASRELVEVDGRPATEEEKAKVARADEKQRKKQDEREAERKEKAREEGEDEEIGRARRLSDLIDRFDYTLAGEVEEGGRLFYVLEFRPRPGARGGTWSDRALASLAGRVLVDASDFQVASVEARLTAPVKVAGGLAANVKEATLSYRGTRLSGGTWFPCRVELRLKGKTALVARLDAAFRFEFSGFAVFSVETESAVGGPSVQSAP